jgi:sensor domain CHASE-containing protein
VSAQNDPRPVVTSPVPRPRAERQGDIDYQNDSQTQGLKKAWEAMYRYWPNWKSS